MRFGSDRQRKAAFARMGNNKFSLEAPYIGQYGVGTGYFDELATDSGVGRTIFSDDPYAMFIMPDTTDSRIDEILTTIGGQKGLTGKKLENYKLFINGVFPRSGKEVLSEGYLEEWADRFASDSEYRRSDLAAQAVLNRIDPDYYSKFSNDRTEGDLLMADYLGVDDSDIASRKDLLKMGEKVAPLVTFQEFKKEWFVAHPGDDAKDSIIREFFGDYITSNSPNVKAYFKSIQSDMSHRPRKRKPSVDSVQKQEAYFERPDKGTDPYYDYSEEDMRYIAEKDAERDPI